jgi:hypothetical protein
MWFDIIKEPTKNLKFHYGVDYIDMLKTGFKSDPNKMIGFIPITDGEAVGRGRDAKALASELGLKYKTYPQRFKVPKGGGSYANGGHFMWNESGIEPYLEQTDFNSVQELVDYVANNSYTHKPYRRIIDSLFGTPDITLLSDRRERDFRGKQRGFE